MATGHLSESLGAGVPAVPAARAGSPRRARRTLLLLGVVCVLPVAASYLAFYVWQPSGRVNHGELVQPAALPAGPLAGAGTQGPLSRAELEGRWTLVYAGPSACTDPCRDNLHAMRQARLAQGRDQERIGRLWLVTDDKEPDVAPDQADLRTVRASAGWLAQLPGAERGTHLYLVDPLGNVMMRFPPLPAGDAAIGATRGIVKDLQRLLKYSALGRGGRDGSQG